MWILLPKADTYIKHMVVIKQPEKKKKDKEKDQSTEIN